MGRQASAESVNKAKSAKDASKSSSSPHRVFSPLDGRYESQLPDTLSEESSIQFQVDVEAAWLLTLGEYKIAPKIPESVLQKVWSKVSSDEIAAIEQRTQHATRALVEVLAERLTREGYEELAQWVHVGLTSFDTVDTAYRLRWRAFYRQDFLPELNRLIEYLVDLGRSHRGSVQCGRTHGQWAVPTVFGLQAMEAAERLREIQIQIENALGDLRGQSSGAIGGYHASSLLSERPLDLERDFLNRLSLKPHYGSIQTLPPEDVFLLASHTLQVGAVVAKLAGDYRHLARSEIGEVSEGMREGQVGSSTMPQKRNPWNLEHVCSLYKVLKSRYGLLVDDLVTEHQRDLTNSASGRFAVEFFATSYLMVLRLNKILKSLSVDVRAMQKHLEQAGTSVLAEAFYVEATRNGVRDAHDVVRKAARQSESSGEALFDILKKQKAISAKVQLSELQRRMMGGTFQKFAVIESAFSNSGVKSAKPSVKKKRSN